MSVLHVPLKDVVPNKYRNIKDYKISEDRIEALIQSYDKTGFWDGSIQARPHPTKDGKYEIAFGHHRIEAARRHGLTEVGLVVANRSHADMLLMMADENSEEFKHDALVTAETVGSVIEAYGRGEIELEALPTTGGRRDGVYTAQDKPYTLQTVARFLGWVKTSNGQATSACQRAFEAYHEQAGATVARQLLPTDKRSEVAVQSVITAARVARKEAKHAGKDEREQEHFARKAAKQQAEAVIKESGFKERQRATRVGKEVVHGKLPPVELSRFIHQRADGLKARVVNLEVEVDGLLNEIMPYRDQADEAATHHLLRVLADADKRMHGLFKDWIERFTDRSARDITPRRKLLKGA